MKKILLLFIILFCLVGCENKVEDNNTDIDSTSTYEEIPQINIDDYPEIKTKSDNLIYKLNSINNDNILTYKGITLEKSIFFVSYITDQNLEFTIRYNKDYEYVGITMTNNKLDEYSKDFIQVRTKFLSLVPFYEECSKIKECNYLITGLDEGNYTINNIKITNSNVLKVFSITNQDVK